MENKGEKGMKMEMLMKYWRKLKKLLTFPDRSASILPSRAVSCDELFIPSGAKKSHPRNDIDIDPFIAAHIAAQNHFSLRPNLYI